MRNFTLTQTGQEVQDILNQAVVYGTTSYWESLPEFVPVEGQIVVYSDYATNEPGLKVGDGVTAVGSLAFLGAAESAALLEHINDSVRHITAAERSAWNAKQDAEPGKGLSTEDYTTAEKEKLAGIEAGADRSVNSDWEASSGKAAILHKPDLSQFVTKTVNDLVNYYLKSEVYTKEEVAQLLSAITTGFWQPVPYLPEPSADTFGFKIYLVPSQEPQSQNVKDEYITVRSGDPGSYTYSWERIGSTAIDPSDYVTNEALQTALEGYVSTEAFQQALAGKADKDTDAVEGNFAAFDSSGNPVDSGHKHSDYLTSHQDISGKADKVSNPTSGNFAGLDANGNLTDSGSKASDFATAAQGAKADTAYQKPSGGIPSTDMSSDVQTSLGKADTAYQKPANGIPASDLASGVIPTVPTDVVKYTSQSLTDAQKAQARTNIGAGTYSKPSGGIPATDLADPESVFIIPVNKDTQTVDPSITYQDIADAYNAGKVLAFKATSSPPYLVCATTVLSITGAIALFAVNGGISGNSVTSTMWALSASPSGIDFQIQEDQLEVPEISTDIDTDGTSDTKTASPKAVKTFVEGKGYGTYSKPSGGIPASDLASGVIPSVPVQDVTVGGSSVLSGTTAVIPSIPDAVSANPTVPSGTTPTALTGLKIGSNYYDIEAGGGTVTDVTVGGTSVVNASGVAVVPAIPTVEALTTSEIDTIIAAVV